MTRGTDEGFSLIEVLLAAAILSTALASLVMLMPRALDATRVAGERSTATTLARDALEELTSLPGSGLASGSDIVTTPAAGTFVRRWQVSPGAGGDVDLAVVRVEVQRRANTNAAERTSFVTLSRTLR